MVKPQKRGGDRAVGNAPAARRAEMGASSAVQVRRGRKPAASSLVQRQAPHTLVQPTEDLRELLEHSQASATTKAHASDWKAWTSWCRRQGFEPLPAKPEAIALYIADQGGRLKPSTIARHLSSISVAHLAAGFDPPPTRAVLVRKALSGLRRTKGVAPLKKAPLLIDELRALSRALNTEELVDIRDRALILTMFSCALRRSEAADLNVEDIEFTKRGYILTKRRSKTDQEAKGKKIAVSYGDTESCPVIALRAWIKAAGLKVDQQMRSRLIQKEPSPLFRSVVPRLVTMDGQDLPRPVKTTCRLTPHWIGRIIKDRVKLLGLDARKFGGHSLRSGFITTAAAAGVDERRIAKVSGHTDMTTLRGYIQEADVEADELSRKIGL